MTPRADRRPAGAAEPSSIDAVILDVDGTVATCPYDFDAMRAAVADVAAKWEMDAAALGIRGIIEQIAALADQLGDRGPAFRAEAEQAVVAIEAAAARDARLLPGAAAALNALRARGVSVALITRNCRTAADIVLHGLADYDLLLTRDDVPRAKPDPDHVLRALDAVGASADRAAVVGDHAFDMEAGRAAGARLCLGVRTGTSSDESLLEAGAHAVIDSIADLPAWLQRRGGPIS
ncbi:MAG: HAD-IA family hydrolase [Armatimonadetes bacterium]|nr:HAD-IA family hydrolase [Armatimonadota bacterium]